MKLKVLGSSSAGNCYILETDTEALILEVGISFKDVKKALDFNISKIVGVLISHSHGDHAKYISDYMKAGIEVYTSDETQEYLEIVTGEYVKSMMPGKVYKIGNFTIQPFELVHSVPCLGFYIKHPDMGKLLFVTDTEYVPQSFKSIGINHILIESNYDKDLLCEVSANSIKRNHVLTGHMEINTTLQAISTNDNPFLMNVILLHLSESNSDSEKFLQKTKEIVCCDCYIADKGLELNLNLIPFM